MNLKSEFYLYLKSEGVHYFKTCTFSKERRKENSSRIYLQLYEIAHVTCPSTYDQIIIRKVRDERLVNFFIM